MLLLDLGLLFSESINSFDAAVELASQQRLLGQALSDSGIGLREELGVVDDHLFVTDNKGLNLFGVISKRLLEHLEFEALVVERAEPHVIVLAICHATGQL